MVQVQALSQKPSEFSSELLVIALTEERLRDEKNNAIPIASGDLTGEKGQMVLYYPGAGKAKRILLVGLGKEKELTVEKIRKTLDAVVKKAKSLKVKSFAVSQPSISGISKAQWLKSAAEGIILGHYDFNRFKEEKEKIEVQTAVFLVESAGDAEQAKTMLEESTVIFLSL